MAGPLAISFVRSLAARTPKSLDLKEVIRAIAIGKPVEESRGSKTQLTS